MPFGFSSSRNVSETDSSSFNNLDQSGFSFGQSGNVSQSSSVGSSESGSQSSSQSSSSQDVAFRDIFENLFSGASGVADRLSGDTSLVDTANRIFDSGQGFISNLVDGGVGADYLQGRIRSGMQNANDRIDTARGNISRFLSEEIVPGITSAGVQAGTLGGDRDTLARGIASGRAATEFATVADEIRTDEQNSIDRLASTLLQDETARTSAAISANADSLNLATQAQLSEFAPFQALASIVGGPTVLSESGATGESSSFGISSQLASALSEAFGINVGGNQTVGRGGSTTRTRSEGRSRGIDIGSIFG